LFIPLSLHSEFSSVLCESCFSRSTLQLIASQFESRLERIDESCLFYRIDLHSTVCGSTNHSVDMFM
jgi:hypothetical protein